MARLLAIDIGSSSVKSAVLDARAIGEVVRVPLATDFHGERVEMPAPRILAAIHQAVRGLRRKRLDAVVISSMGPSWLAIDRRGNALTPVVTHQDRRSLREAREIESGVGAAAHLRIVGARPIPGGISSTTARWFARHAPGVLKRAALLGHLPTFLLNRWCGARVIDPSHASFTGLFQTIKLADWDDALIAAAGVKRAQLPRIVQANDGSARLTRAGSEELGLPIGTPVFPGILDGSVPMLFAGAANGRLINSCGSTDVLAMCVNRPRPNAKLLTRALGVGKWWLAVSTISAAGSAIDWARRIFFNDMPDVDFEHLLMRIDFAAKSQVKFTPSLLGQRSEIEPSSAAFCGLALSTSREDMLRAILVCLRDQSALRLKLIAAQTTKLQREVLVTGGGGATAWMQSAWPGRFRFHRDDSATLAGLGRLVQ
jgi:xylulokinase